MSSGMDQETISGAELDQLKTVDPSTSGNEEQRFLQECSGWYQEWLHANEPQLQANAIPSTQVLVIVFSESPDVERTRLAAMGESNHRIYRGALDAGLQGTLLTTQNLRRIIQIRETFSSLNEAMVVCCDTLEDSDTFVIIPLAQRRVLIHPRDVSIDDWVHNPTSIPVRSQTIQISAAQIDKDIYGFYDEGLRLAKSSLSQMIWKGKKYPYELIQDPERRIQSYLLITLRQGYAHLMGVVDEETVGKGGRCDITVQWPTPLGAHPYANAKIELKVLTQARGAASNVRWAQKGIKQANDYRLANSEAVFACVFDGRKDQADQMPHLDAEAATLSVELRRYLMEAPIDPPKASTPRKAAAAAAGAKAAKKKTGGKKAATKKAASNKAPKATTSKGDGADGKKETAGSLPDKVTAQNISAAAKGHADDANVSSANAAKSS